eukprot:CAMPEP_0175443220 /NCGR_PEP_ID=MMETSP0095-20121207/58563_1 /TAXON_ID=311494 /ORGANISM="Alexandrium monilatum, Strain CCMP3105" /LENGTH=104 /DNA_ID=CAMNT_0016743297 /DNA_START=56 /DNA_END=366 /DNA_ORIENTATION=+
MFLGGGLTSRAPGNKLRSSWDEAAGACCSPGSVGTPIMEESSASVLPRLASSFPFPDPVWQTGPLRRSKLDTRPESGSAEVSGPTLWLKSIAVVSSGMTHSGAS